jgi:hypothetical protein
MKCSDVDTLLAEVLTGERLPSAGTYFGVIGDRSEVRELEQESGHSILFRALAADFSEQALLPLAGRDRRAFTVAISLWPSQHEADEVAFYPDAKWDAVSSVYIGYVGPPVDSPCLLIHLFLDQRDDDPVLWRRRCRFFTEKNLGCLLELLKAEIHAYREYQLAMYETAADEKAN